MDVEKKMSTQQKMSDQAYTWMNLSTFLTSFLTCCKSSKVCQPLPEGWHTTTQATARMLLKGSSCTRLATTLYSLIVFLWHLEITSVSRVSLCHCTVWGVEWKWSGSVDGWGLIWTGGGIQFLLHISFVSFHCHGVCFFSVCFYD